MLEHLNFNHKKDDIIDAMGLDQRDYEVARKTIHYEMLIQVLDLTADHLTLDSERMTSRSNVLEFVLNRFVNEPKKQICALFTFHVAYTQMKEALSDLVNVLDNIKDAGSAEDFFTKGTRAFERIQAGSIDEALNKIKIMLRIKPLMQSIMLLKESDGDYAKYIAFTVDNVSLQDALNGILTPPENDEDEDEEGSDDFRDDFLEFLKSRGKGPEKKKKRKSYKDIDDIIKRALDGKDEEEE